MAIPFDRLGIPKQFRRSVGSSAPKNAKIAVAKGLIPTTADVQLSLLYVLAVDKDKVVAKAARQTLDAMPVDQVLSGISQSTFPKVLEFIANFKPDRELDQRLLQLRSTPDRAAELVASRADAGMCEILVRNQERLLMTPTVFVSLHANPRCSDEELANAESFLRMHGSLPEVPDRRPFMAAEELAAPVAKPKPKGNLLDHLFDDDSEAKPEAKPEAEPVAPASPCLAPAVVDAPVEDGLGMFELDKVGVDTQSFEAFKFDFEDDMSGFSWDFTRESDDGESPDDEDEGPRLSLEQKLGEMSVGRKIKLAYMGNQQARKILIRDPNKVVAAAVVKSGRLTPNEVAAFAGNRNLHDEVVRLIAQNKEFIRKYPVQVALVNNPKCPAPLALKLMKNLQKRDLQQVANNKNVPSVIFGTALKMFKAKYRK
jgi:hypothetical protein